LSTLPALKNRFCGDDLGLIVNNPQLAATSPLPLLTRSFASGAVAAHRLPVSYYRPLTSSSFWLDRHLWGLRPLPYHLHNLLLNLACVVFVFLILNLLLSSPIAAAIGSLLFALHPMHAESVAYVSGRTDLLMSVFVLAAFYLLLLAHKRMDRRLVALAIVAFALALLAKETAVMFPFFCLAWFVSAELIHRRDGNRESGPRGRLGWIVFAALLVTTAGYLTTRAGILGPGLRLTPDVRPAQFPALVLNTLGLYFKLFFFPFRHQPYYPFRADFRSFNGYGAFAIGIVLLAVVAAKVRILNSSFGLRHSSFFLGLSWTLLFLLPVLNLLFLSGPIAAERFLYLPSFGMILLVAALVHRFVRARRRMSLAVVTVSLAVAVMLAINLLTNLSIWRDDLTLSRAIAKATPDFAMAHNSLGVALKEQGQVTAAEPEFARAISLKPDYAEAHNNLGATREALGDRNSALAEYRLAVNYDSTYAVARNNLGAALGALGEPDSAIVEFLAALRFDPDNAEAHNNLGVTYYSLLTSHYSPLTTHYKELARQEFLSALKLRPDYVRALVNLARLELADGNRDAARDLLDRARRIAPDDRQVQALLPVLSQ
jgi:tetratricopeptide (TPR) repeat protein